jgi:glyoxylase-like metal-dependent hydrolase (beta-lactamase superfamily II)
MEVQNDPKFRADFWDRVFPGQLPRGEVDVSVVDERGFELEGVALLPVEVGHTDTDATTMLHVPAASLLVAGDVVYNGVHLYLTESGGVTGIDEWLAALDTAEGLNPATVIAGHKAPGAFDSPAQIQATRRYLTDARRLLQSSDTAEAFYEAMLRLHPNRVNAGALWGAAITLFPPA